MNTVWEKRRKRLFEIIEIGSNYDAVCWGYDFFNTLTILLNLTVSIMYTFDNMELKYGPLLLTGRKMAYNKEQRTKDPRFPRKKTDISISPAAPSHQDKDTLQ